MFATRALLCRLLGPRLYIEGVSASYSWFLFSFLFPNVS